MPQQQATTPRRFPESHKKKNNNKHRRFTDAFFLGLGAVVYLTVQLVGPRWSTTARGGGFLNDSSNTATLLWQDAFFSTTVRRRAAAVDTTDHAESSTTSSSTMKHPSLAIYNNDDDYPTDAKPMVIGPDYKPPSYYLRKQQQKRIKHQQQQQRIMMNMNEMTLIMRLGRQGKQTMQVVMKNMAARAIPHGVSHHQEEEEEEEEEEDSDDTNAPNNISKHSYNNMLVLSVLDQHKEESSKKRPVKATSRNMINVVGPQKQAPSLPMRRGGQARRARNRKQQQEQLTRNLRVEDGRHPIFYNFYVPPDNYRKAILIAQEQMRQRDLLAPGAPLYYTLIGYPNITTKYCEPNCWQYQYLDTGHEVDTLQSLWEYCHEVGQDDEWVTYIHDKGSFHDNGNNKRARKIGTRAALACRKLLLNRDPDSHNWNVCGASFTVLPQFHTNANMWTAKCSYVKELYEPLKYAQAMEEMYNNTLRHPILGNTTYACMQPSTWRGTHVGTGRYTGERWVYSHPNVTPCSSLGFVTVGKATTDFTPRLLREPRHKAHQSSLTNHRFHNAFARLEGRLFEWDYLYGKKPPEDSWIWNYYKDYQTGTEEYFRECKAVADATRTALTNAGVTVPNNYNTRDNYEILKHS